MFMFDSKITFHANRRQRVRMSLDRNLSGSSLLSGCGYET